ALHVPARHKWRAGSGRPPSPHEREQVSRRKRCARGPALAPCKLRHRALADREAVDDDLEALDSEAVGDTAGEAEAGLIAGRNQPAQDRPATRLALRDERRDDATADAAATMARQHEQVGKLALPVAGDGLGQVEKDAETHEFLAH